MPVQTRMSLWSTLDGLEAVSLPASARPCSRQKWKTRWRRGSASPAPISVRAQRNTLSKSTRIHCRNLRSMHAHSKSSAKIRSPTTKFFVVVTPWNVDSNVHTPFAALAGST
jgi:hypothetical protein